MPRKRGLILIAVCAGILFAAPARAAVTYTFTSDEGDFTYVSPSFEDGGNVPDSLLASHSGDFDDVFFGSSDILLVNAACKFNEDCFDATFLETGIFLQTGTFFASDGDAKIVISGSPTAVPAPELSSWALLAIGFAGLAFARNRRIRGSRA